MSEGSLSHPSEHQHPALLETLKSFRFSSVDMVLFVWHTDHTAQRGAPAARGERAALALEGDGAGFAAPGELAVGGTTRNDIAPFPSTAAKHSNLC